jgi:cell wall-associated NlpC family hydrolase
MNHEQIARWETLPKVIVTEDCGVARSSSQETGGVVSDVVAGAILALKKDISEAFQVEYPDGRTAYLLKRSAQPFVQWLSEANATPERLIATAMRFIGIPYLWGGTSGKGFDCSGLTKVVYFLNGIHLPRDAGQQATAGAPVDPGAELEHVEIGDLLFFGSKADSTTKQRVTHVGLYLGNRKFINASSVPGYVVITSLNPADAEYSADRGASFLLARRIIGAGETSGVRRVASLPYYSGSDH